jgi:cyclophilin family peptidyl-prolyl cis-trans isomerase
MPDVCSPFLFVAQHVVFGQVVEGMSVVRAVEAAGAEARVRIADCGALA